MKRGMFKRITAFMLAITMVFTIMPTNVIASEITDRSTVTATKDNITVEKKARFTGEKDENGNPKIEITFKVDTSKLKPETEVVTSGKTDIVLVIDKSGSMEGKKITNAKTAAKNFVDKVLKYKDVRVGLVSFSGETDKLGLTNNKNSLKNKINGINADGGTFIQAGIKDAQEMLKSSTANNKIIILLSDGEPTYRYSLKTVKKWWGWVPYWDEDDSTINIKAPLANPTSYDAYWNFTTSVTGDGSYSDEMMQKATISQAYLARKDIAGLNIYSVGYDIGKNSDAENVLKTIADKDKYQTSTVNGLDKVISNITKEVEKAINGVNLVDKIPSQMSLVNGKTTTPSDITASTVNGGIKFTWNKALEKKVYTMSFETVLNLSELNAADYKENPYFNTNGTTVVVGGNGGASSSTLSYGTSNEAKITLDSPQLRLQSYKYDIDYFYDKNGDKEYTSDEKDTTEDVSESGYVFDRGNNVVSIVDKNNDTDNYELDKVVINNEDKNFGDLTVNEDKVVKVYYKQKVKKTIIITKVWDDNDDQDGKRDESVEFKVTRATQDGNPDDSFEITDTLNEGNNWTYTKTGLDPNYVYTVTEPTVPEGYSCLVIPTDSQDNKGQPVTTYEIKNSHTPETVSIPVTVEWEDDDNRDGIRPSGAAVTLYKQIGNGEETEVETKTLSGSYSFTSLPKYSGGKLITYTVRQAKVDKYEEPVKSEDDTNTFTNKYTPEKRKITVEKIWKNGGVDSLRSPITVQIQKNGTLIEGKEIVLDEENNYKNEFTDLYKNEAGKPITYTIIEKNVPNKYKVTYDQNAFKITNTYGQDEKVSVSVTKSWNDSSNVDGLRPETVTVQLVRNNSLVEGKTITLSESNSWQGSFDNLPEYDEEGAKITYFVEEINVPDGYTDEVSGSNNNFTITNTHNQDMTKTVTFKKVWSGDNHVSQLVRPDTIKVKLYANDTFVKEKEFKVDKNSNENEYSFEDLPRNCLVDGKSQPINYTVSEELVDNYNTSYSADTLTITNTYVPIKLSKQVVKSWNDDNNHDGKQPGKVYVSIIGTAGDVQQTVYTDKVELGPNGWSHVFNNLPKYTDEGEEISYEIVETDEEGNRVEKPVPGYERPRYETVGDVTTITNTRPNETKNIKVIKNWNDGDDRDDKRPDSITFQLKKNGDVVKTLELTEKNVVTSNSNQWTGEFTNLLVYGKDASGVKKNEYEVVEVVPEGSEYTADKTSSVIADDQTEVSFTNSYTPEKTSITMTKIWNDESNRDGVRPRTIKVKIMKKVGENEPVEVETRPLDVDMSTDSKEYTFDNLYKYENGQEIIYSVEEVNDNSNYTATTEGLTIINTHNVETVNISANKSWFDNQNAANERPRSITVQLKKTVNGQTSNVGEAVTITAPSIPGTQDFASGTLTVATDEIVPAQNWSHTWPALPKKENGNVIVYSLEELPVEGYTEQPIQKLEQGNTITFNINNTYNVVRKDSLTVKKIWYDVNNQDGKRPAYIKVQLLKNGVPEGEPNRVDASTDWQASWNNLVTSKDGVDYTYTVRELTDEASYADDEAYSLEWVDEYTLGQPTPVYAGEDNDRTIVGYTITNTHEPAKTTFSVEKIWEDDNNRDGIRPDNVTIRLFRDGEEMATSMRILKEGNNGKWTADLGTMCDYTNGKKHEYIVKEDPVKGYTTTTPPAENGKFTVTNTHTTKKVSPTIKFVWDDVENKEEIRPTSMQATIKGTITTEVDGQEEKEVVVNKLIEVSNDTWIGGWTDLPVYHNKKKITYSVEQAGLPEKYTPGVPLPKEYIPSEADSISGETTFVITNKYVPTVEKTITIIWDDDNDNNKKRPTEVTIQPTVDGKPEGEPIKVNFENKDKDDDNKWSTPVTLPKYDEEGKEIEYKVSQNEVPDYKTTYSEDTLTITNKYEPKKEIIIPINPPFVPTEPSEEPTEEPSEEPTVTPSEQPTEDVTVNPSEPAYVPNKPATNPTVNPSDETTQPSRSRYLLAPSTTNTNNNSGQGSDSTPTTGDDNNIALYVLVMILSSCGMIGLYLKRKGKRA